MGERGRKPPPVISDLSQHALEFVYVRQLADYTGIPGRTLRYWCRTGIIAGASRRSPKPESEWRIPTEEARRIERECGLTTKRQPAA